MVIDVKCNLVCFKNKPVTNKDMMILTARGYYGYLFRFKWYT